MPLPKELLQETAVRRAASEEEANRIRSRELVGGMLSCIGWCALGLFLVLWSAHTANVVHGRMAFWAGLGIGNGGIIFTLLAVWRRGEQRGDW